MAKIHLSRLQEKYEFSSGTVKGGNYRTLVKDIIENETINTARRVGRISQSSYIKQMAKVKDISQKLILPSINEVMGKRTVFVRKAAIDGDIMTDTLRDSLTKNLRQSLSEFKTKKTKEPAYIRRRGEQAGTINPKVIKDFEESITNTFKEYTKINPKYGVPSNVHQIAITEIRKTISPMKQAYNEKLYNKNKDKFDFFKEWRQNISLSKVPRLGHSLVDRMVIKITDMFQVPRFVKTKGSRWVKVATDSMRFPHDPQAVAKQVIGCSCDCIYSAVPKN